MKQLFLFLFKLQLGQIHQIFAPVLFFITALIIYPLALPYGADYLSISYAPLIIIIFIFAVIMSSFRNYEDDISDGFLEQIILHGITTKSIFIAKFLVNWLFITIPIIISLPIISLLGNIEYKIILFLSGLLFLISPIILLFSNLASILMVEIKKNFLISIIILLPLNLPVIILSCMSIESFVIGKDLIAALDYLKVIIGLIIFFAPIILILSNIMIKNIISSN